MLHGRGDINSNRLWKIVGKGPKVYSLNDLDGKKARYPKEEIKSEVEEKFYLVIEIEPLSEKEFLGVSWDFKALKNFKTRNLSGRPFTASLSELAKVKI